MIRSLLLPCLVVSAVLVAPADSSAQPVLPRSLANESTPGTMVNDALMRQVRHHSGLWRERYEARTEASQIAAYQTEMREALIERIGGLPERTDLNAQVVGRIEREGFTVEKILFESMPHFHVTGGLFLPDPERFPPPWPAVLVVCGHSANGKEYDGYQRGTALAALHGIAGLIIDPIGQGERKQVLDAEGTPAVESATTEHTLLGTAAILVGWNTARWQVWDAMRGVDYLQSRSDIDGDRIGCMGNSGGGTQTSYLMALDPRIRAAAPSCYLTSFQRLLETIGPQDAEQNIHGQIALGVDHADYIMMRAPRPTLIACATKDFFDIAGTWDSYRAAKRLYTRLGEGQNVTLVEVDAGHGWHPLLRASSVQFMLQHLKQEIAPVQEPEITVLSSEEFRVSPSGQVLQMEGEISAFEHVRLENQRLAAERERFIEASPREVIQQRIRELAGVRPMSELAEPTVEWSEPRNVDGQIHQPLVLQVEDDIWLPAVLIRANDGADHERESVVTCVFDAEGKDAALSATGIVEQRLQLGHTVLAIDVRGSGETLPTGRAWYHERFGRNGGNATIAYLMGQSFVGLRAEDMLQAARWVTTTEKSSQVHVVATGELTVPALHAAALEPERFATVELRGGLDSWSRVVDTPLSINQVPNVVHGALRVYDLPDLAAMLGERLILHDQRDATEQPLQ